MAIMLPARPKEFNANSLEDLMFDGLAKLSDEYYVFHSFKIINVDCDQVKESETDFLIFNKNKGIVCIEAKAGKVGYSDGYWRYGSGQLMKGDGPFAQASKNKWKVKAYLDEKCSNITNRCKILSAVWFPSIDKSELNVISFPPEADKRLIMMKNNIENPQEAIDKIFELNVAVGVETQLSEKDVQDIIQKALCPTFDLVPSKSIEIDVKRNRFNKLLKEQSIILDFLEEQRLAVVNGVAGTGKTMIAVEKARRCGLVDKTLFLCYNIRLKEHLEKTFPYENVSYYTIDGFACKFCKTHTTDYNLFNEKLIEAFVGKSFPYTHLILDEGQDFGQEQIEEYNIIQTLEEIILAREIGTFYMFYDKLQLVQGAKIPKYIEEADCRLTLYKNCRNTKAIANTSLKPLDRQPKLFDGAIEGDLPVMYFIENDVSTKINAIIDSWISKGIMDIVILTCKSQDSSCITSFALDEVYHYRNKDFIFNSTRRFKGLEADVIILIDVDRSILVNNEKLFYVGSSRARMGLEIVSNLSDDNCMEIMKKLGYLFNAKSKKKQLASALGCVSG